MNTRKISHPNLYNGKEFEIKYVITDKELNDQIVEILDQESYGQKFKDGTYLDLGANTGLATLYFSQFASKVYSLEPNPDIYKTLVENTKDLKNVETFNYGWGTASGREFFFADPDGEHQPQTLFGRGENLKSIAVELLTPTNFFKLAKIEHIDIMKIDVEEAEYLIFPDNDFGEVAGKIDTIIGEAHCQQNGGFPEIIPALLKQWGYETEFLKLPKPNYYQIFHYQNFRTGQKVKVSYPRETIFLAKKNDKTTA